MQSHAAIVPLQPDGPTGLASLQEWPNWQHLRKWEHEHGSGLKVDVILHRNLLEPNSCSTNIFFKKGNICKEAL